MLTSTFSPVKCTIECRMIELADHSTQEKGKKGTKKHLLLFHPGQKWSDGRALGFADLNTAFEDDHIFPLSVRRAARAHATNTRRDSSSRTDNAGHGWRPGPAEPGRKRPRAAGGIARASVLRATTDWRPRARAWLLMFPPMLLCQFRRSTA